MNNANDGLVDGSKPRSHTQTSKHMRLPALPLGFAP